MPTLLLLDSQAVDNSDTGRDKGFCHYKNVNGIKRHLCVDTLGNILFVHCTSANISDDQGLLEMLSNHISYFKNKPVNTKKITILVDNGYHKNYLEKQLQLIYPQILTKIRIEISPKPTKDPNNPEDKTFKPVHKRWVVERTNAWTDKCRIFWKHCEKLLSTAVAKLQLCSIRLQIKRLARG
jgi:transposase